MKIEELKRIIKPMIKECIKEVLLEEGLSKMIAEAKTQPAMLPVDDKAEARFEQMLAKKQAAKVLASVPQKAPLQETRKKMLDAIGNSGFDAFAGTEPLKEEAEVKGSDPGIDISGLMGNKDIWKQKLDLMNKKK
jgi:hypothetical protein